jgi:hypothetical protein
METRTMKALTLCVSLLALSVAAADASFAKLTQSERRFCLRDAELCADRKATSNTVAGAIIGSGTGAAIGAGVVGVASAARSSQTPCREEFSQECYSKIFGHFVFFSHVEELEESSSGGAKPMAKFSREAIGQMHLPGIVSLVVPFFSYAYPSAADTAGTSEQIIDQNTANGPFLDYVNLIRAAGDSFEGSDMRLLQRNKYTVVLRDGKGGLLELPNGEQYSCGETPIPIQGERFFSIYLGELPSDNCPEPPKLTQEELKEAIKAEYAMQKTVFLQTNWTPDHAAWTMAMIEKQTRHWAEVAQNIDCRTRSCFSLTSVELDLQFFAGEPDVASTPKPEWETFGKIRINRWQNPMLED